MKVNFPKVRIYRLFWMQCILFSFLLLSSCSFFSRRTQKSTTKTSVGTVPKEQYEQLLKKYEALLKNEQKKKDVTQQQVAKVKESLGNTELVETVDVFDGEGKVKGSLDSKVDIADMNISDDVIENQIINLRKAKTFIDQNKFNNALELLKELERSQLKQIKVQAKYLVGELLFKQGEFDLAMQIFEEILNKYSFSGVVLKTLGRLIICSEKLKLSKKREKYNSILHDFFEAM